MFTLIEYIFVGEMTINFWCLNCHIYILFNVIRYFLRFWDFVQHLISNTAIITVSGRVLFFVDYRNASGCGRWGRGTRDATDRTYARRSRPNAAVVWVRMICYGCPSVCRRVSASNRWRRGRLLVRFQCSQL